MAEPQFNPAQPFTAAPAFDPSQPFTAAAGGPDFTATNEPPSPSLWARANTPLIPQIADAAHAIADHLDAPAIHRSKMEAQVRGFLAGATGAAGDVAASFTSPIGLALSLAGLSGESAMAQGVPGLKALLELPAVRTLQKSVQAASGAAFAGEGAARAVNAPTIGGKAQGVAEAATGALGMVPAGRAALRVVGGSPLPRTIAAELVKHGTTAAAGAAGSYFGPVGTGVGAVMGREIGGDLAARIRAGGPRPPPPPDPNLAPPGVDRYMPNVSGASAASPTPPSPTVAPTPTPPVTPTPAAATAAAPTAFEAAQAARQSTPPPAPGPIVKASGKMQLTGPEFLKFQELTKSGVPYQDAYAQLMAARFGGGAMTDAEVAAEQAARKRNRSPRR